MTERRSRSRPGTSPAFPPLDRRATNPVSLRVWYPRLVDDARFERLVGQLKEIKADRVYLFDNGYMDNFQLAPETLAERLPVLKRRIAQLREEGILAGINSGATIGHGGNMQGAERLMDLDWWMGSDGRERVGIACPLGQRFGQWLETYFRGLAQTGALEIFVDDDLRLYNHGTAGPRDWGCLCDLHLSAMQARTGRTLTREQLLSEIAKLSPGPVQEAWMALWKENFLDLLSRIETTVHGVDPRIRLGLMPVQNFVRNFGETFLREAIRALSRGTRPLLRTHDYHGLPHEMIPGSGLAAKRTAPPESEHLVEIENIAHNCHDYVRSPQTTRYAILNALALGMGGAAPTFGDSERDMPWERKYLDMLRVNDRFFRTVADLTYRGTVQGGIPIRHRAYQREVSYIDARENIWNDSRSEDADLLSGLFGVAYRFDACPVWLLGELPASMSKEEVGAALARGAIIDAPGLACLLRLGHGDRLGVSVAEPVPYRRGHRFLPHPLNGEHGGDTNALRADFPTYRLEVAADIYEEVSEFVSWNGRRVAGGILVQRGGQGRNVILPHVLSTTGSTFTGLVSAPYRHLMRGLLGFALGEPLKLTLEAPPRIAPFYFERGDGTVVVTLLNAYYDDVYDVDLVFGDGGRLLGRKVCRVMPSGRIAHRPTLAVRRAADGSYRLRLDKANAIENCNVLVLTIG